MIPNLSGLRPREPLRHRRGRQRRLRRPLLRRHRRPARPRIPNLYALENHFGAIVLNNKKGTTTLSFIFDKGVIVAADSRASMGGYTSSQTVRKIIKINPYMLGTMAGGAADCQFWHRNLVAKGVGLYYVDSEGARLKGSRFSVGSALCMYLGCGLQILEEAAELARRAIYRVTFRDGASGGCVSDSCCGRKKWEERWKKWMLCGLNNQKIQETREKTVTTRPQDRAHPLTWLPTRPTHTVEERTPSRLLTMSWSSLLSEQVTSTSSQMTPQDLSKQTTHENLPP